MAEGVGFEPTGRLHAQRFSRPPRSTALAPLRKTGHPVLANGAGHQAAEHSETGSGSQAA